MTIIDVDVKASAILFPALIFFMLLGIITAMGKAAIDEMDYWLPEFATTWRFVTRNTPPQSEGGK